MNIAERTVLVTGADGFIGSHLVERLVEGGSKVHALTYYNSFNSWGWLDTIPRSTLDKLEVFPGDVRDSNSVRTAMTGCDVVFHLAALISIPYSYHAPESYIDTNVKGTLNTVQAAKDLNVKKVIVTSTSEVYGTAQYVPIDEDHPLQAQSPYAATKIGADQLALSFFRSFNTPVAVIRPFNTFGPRQSLRAVVPTIILQIASGAKELKLGALEPTRDFNYVVDTVEGFIKVAEAESTIGEVVNVGSGSEISIGDLAQMIMKIMGSKVHIVYEHQRIRPDKSEVLRLLSSKEKLKSLTGWCTVRRFEDSLKDTIDWFINPENLKYYNKIHRYNF